jgi:C_GCAxxG_C_C family probable redox protein
VNTNLADKASACFEKGFSCSQAVFSTFAVEQGMDTKTALGASGAFGGGMAGRGEICGAASGAFMAIGLKYAKVQADDNAARDKTYALCRDFVRQFESEFGSLQCREILGYNVSSPEEYKAAKEAGLFRSKCQEVVRKAAQILTEIT